MATQPASTDHMREALKSYGAILITCVVVQVLFGVIAGRSYLSRHNTLVTNGNWISTKTTLDRGLNGSFAFITEPQALAGGGLDLGAWHGFQEVIHRRSVIAPTRIELDIHLSTHTYLAIQFDGDRDAGFAGIRLSTDPRHPNIFFTSSPSGEFLTRTQLSKYVIKENRPHHVVIELSATDVRVTVDDESLDPVPHQRRDGPLFGLRGGRAYVFADNIRITLASGQVITEEFDPTAGSWPLILGVVVAAVMLNLILFTLLLKLTNVEGKKLSFAFLTANLTLLAIASMLFWFVGMSAKWYPGLDDTLERAEAYYRKGAQETVLADLRSRHTETGADAAYRIMLLGTSQTWGAGAMRDDETWVRVLESKLNQRPGEHRRVECMNAGFSALKAVELAKILAHELLAYRPDMVIINLSSNDRPTSKGFADSLLGMIDACVQIGARPLLMYEANEFHFGDKGLIARFREVGFAGEQRDIEPLNAHGYLTENDDLGFVWWDKVHLTSFGQQLLATWLVDELSGLEEP